MSTNDLDVIDLDAERERRTAQNEGQRKAKPIRMGGVDIAVLPVELPIEVIAPLQDLDESITILLRQAMQVQKASTSVEKWDGTELIIDLLAATPSLPLDVVNVIKRSAIVLLTQEGYERLVAQRLSVPDVVYLAKSVFRYYGVTLGEASTPSDLSVGDGATSSTTSSTTSDSTPVPSGGAPTSPASSESAAS